jgi:tetratricopeptide (TPR) repeat protein
MTADSPTPSPSFQDCTERAKRARQLGDHVQALKWLEKAQDLKPELASLLIEIASELRELGRFHESKKALDDALARNPALASAWAGLGYLARKQGDHITALAHFNQAFGLNPKHATIPVDIATELRELGRFDEALATLRALLETQPESVPAWIGLGQIARGRGERSVALEYFQKAMKLEPGHVLLPIHIATEQRELGRFDEALATLQALLETQPESVPAWIGLGHLARVRGESNLALEHYQKAIAIKPDHPTLPIEIATELRGLGRLDEAKRYLQQHREICDSAAIWHQLGQIALFEDNSDEALRCFEAGIQARPEWLPCYLGLINECLRLGHFDKAETILAQGLLAVSNPLRLETLRARLLKARGEFDAALESARQLTLSHTDDFECKRLLVELLTQIAGFDEAEGILNGVKASTLTQQFQLAMLQAQLARARYDIDIAERHLKLALHLNPREAPAHHLLSQIHLMRGDTQAANEPLKAAEDILSRHGSERNRQNAKGGLRHQFWREFRTNPFAERALLEACRLPLPEQPAAMLRILNNEPEHAGTAIALLVALNRNRAWDTHHPNARLGKTSPIPRRIIQFWDTPDIPEDIQRTMFSWPKACLGFEHQIFNDASAASFIRRECHRDVVKAFHMAGHPAMRSDLFRLAYLAVKGGLYADADDGCRHDIRDWLKPGYDLLLLQEDVGSIGNNFIAAAPGHPFILAALAEVTRNILRKQGDNIWFISGPGAWSVCFCRHHARQLENTSLPSAMLVQDFYHMQQRISMHLPRNYKQDVRHWLSVKAQQNTLFRFTLDRGN